MPGVVVFNPATGGMKGALPVASTNLEGQKSRGCFDAVL